MHIESARRAESSFAIALLAAALVTIHAPTASADPPSPHSGAHPGYHIISTESTNVAGLRRTVVTVEASDDPIDRFLVTRVALPVEPRALRGALILLPPLGSGFQNFELGEDGDYTRSFAAYFASRGYDVWGYSQRVQGLAAGSCESGAVDCSVMANWGMATIVDDVDYIRRLVAHAHPGARVAVGGLSLGSMAALGVIDAHPHDYEGAFMLEGTLYDPSPQVRSENQGFCAAAEDQLAAGIVYDGQQLPAFKLVAALATVDPEGYSPMPFVPLGYSNHQAFVSLMSTPVVGPVTPRPGYYFLAGDPAADRLTFANDALIRANVGGFVDYVALRTLRDINCSLAGDRTFTNDLSRFRGALFVNAAGHGFGQAMLDTVALMPRAHATVGFVEPFGHIDHFFATNHHQLTEEPLLAWLEREID